MFCAFAIDSKFNFRVSAVDCIETIETTETAC